jgi:uncharacterized secreted protein with C-terminal beta-propeller domain
MNNFQKALAILITIAVVLSLTACDPASDIARRIALDRETRHPDDYSAIYELIKNSMTEREKSMMYAADGDDNSGINGSPEGSAGSEPSASPPAADSAQRNGLQENDAMGGGNGESEDFSGTNNQVEGVEEGDIIKTDGKYIYYASPYGLGKVSVVRADKGNMELVAQFERENSTPLELLLYNEKLIVIWSYRAEKDYELFGDGGWGRWWGWYWYDCETVVEVFDTKGDFSEPISTYRQDGTYFSSRMVGSNIYIISNYTPSFRQNFARNDLAAYIPTFTTNGETRLIPANCIELPEKLDHVEYTIIGGLDVNNTDIFVSTQAVLGRSGVIYSSLNNIYVTATIWEEVKRQGTPPWWRWWGEERDLTDEEILEIYGEDFELPTEWSDWIQYTRITRFSFANGQVGFGATGNIDGYVETQFYLDEYKGVLRVVAQNRDEEWVPEAWLYTLDMNLKQLGIVKGIGPDEFVQSVRYDGDIAYVVTFLLTDPLYAIDLSDPANPFILDELKIPGFSRYLHKWSDTLLLGVGVEADEETGMRTGLKVSMFDITDNENLSELFVHVIGDPDAAHHSWYYSIAEHNHKAVLVCPDKNIIAFPYYYETYNVNDTGEWWNGWEIHYVYAIFEYDEDTGFNLKGEIRSTYTYNQHDYYDWWLTSFERGLYIGDVLYAVAQDRIISANLSDISIIQTLNLA